MFGCLVVQGCARRRVHESSTNNVTWREVWQQLGSRDGTTHPYSFSHRRFLRFCWISLRGARCWCSVRRTQIDSIQTSWSQVLGAPKKDETDGDVTVGVSLYGTNGSYVNPFTHLRDQERSPSAGDLREQTKHMGKCRFTETIGTCWLDSSSVEEKSC